MKIFICHNCNTIYKEQRPFICNNCPSNAFIREYEGTEGDWEAFKIDSRFTVGKIKKGDFMVC